MSKERASEPESQVREKESKVEVIDGLCHQKRESREVVVTSWKVR